MPIHLAQQVENLLPSQFGREVSGTIHEATKPLTDNADPTSSAWHTWPASATGTAAGAISSSTHPAYQRMDGSAEAVTQCQGQNASCVGRMAPSASAWAPTKQSTTVALRTSSREGMASTTSGCDQTQKQHRGNDNLDPWAGFPEDGQPNLARITSQQMQGWRSPSPPGATQRPGCTSYTKQCSTWTLQKYPLGSPPQQPSKSQQAFQPMRNLAQENRAWTSTQIRAQVRNQAQNSKQALKRARAQANALPWHPLRSTWSKSSAPHPIPQGQPTCRPQQQ